VRDQVQRYVLGLQQIRKLDEEEQVVLEVIRDVSGRVLGGFDRPRA